MSEEAQGDAEACINHRRLPRVEKDTDDPTQISRLRIPRQESTTLTTLSRLFAVQAATSPQNSRHPSYTVSQDRYASERIRALQSSEIAPLPEHLYHRGLIGGAHSDITVHAFGTPYRLHRIILDRAPFFSNALSEPWLESDATEITVHPEDIDSAITQSSFELALKRLYGCSDATEEDQDPIGLFATGCWLELYDLVESSVECMLRQMTPETLAPLIKLVTINYYGRAGEKILASAKSMLCRDGWRLPVRFWDGIPAEIVREIVGGDGFFVDNECGRWFLAKRILDRRLREAALAADLIEPGRRQKVRKAPVAAKLMSVRCDASYRRNRTQSLPEDLRKWTSLYTNPDVEPILDLLDEGIHYIHLTFEQLQVIRRAVDCLGQPVVPEKVIGNALWQQMELRQTILSAGEADLELGLSMETTDYAMHDTVNVAQSSARSKSESPNENSDDGYIEIPAASRHGNRHSQNNTDERRRYAIPMADCNTVMGGNAAPALSYSSSNGGSLDTNRSSITGQQENTQSVGDISLPSPISRQQVQKAGNGTNGQSGVSTSRYSNFPPFRFSAEFPNPRLLKDRKRVYSRTVFYAGSHWNMYIKKMASSRSKQLGVYLHRAREQESGEVIEATTGSVDQRIGRLEREMIRRGARRTSNSFTQVSQGIRVEEVDSSASADDDDREHDREPTSNSRGEASARSSMMRSLIGRGQRNSRSGVQAGGVNDNPSVSAEDLFHAASASESEDESDAEGFMATTGSRKPPIPTLPPYVDARPTIKTYFKIYSPSRGGRMLSVYESAPDKFNYSQSWGWKSSSLMIDEGLTGEDGDEQSGKEGKDGAEKDPAQKALSELNDGKLRFMVVIGNV